MKVARALVPRGGRRILAAETFAHDAPLPGYLDHIPRRQALATSMRCCSAPSTPSLSTPLSLVSLLPLSRFSALVVSCGRTTVTIRSQYLGPYDLHNNIYNMTYYNGCAYNVTSPLRVWQCADFNNVWEGSLDNPAPNPTQYQTGDIFVQYSTGYCEAHMNRGADGTVQMFPGETVNILYAWTSDWRPCASELRFSNGNSYSMADISECQAATVI
ncbi:unnamed protein product [Closterium sp. Yama58-4]|nr:unnamed protein product [Closterium sp. Yama58-4]